MVFIEFTYLFASQFWETTFKHLYNLLPLKKASTDIRYPALEESRLAVSRNRELLAKENVSTSPAPSVDAWTHRSISRKEVQKQLGRIPVG